MFMGKPKKIFGIALILIGLALMFLSVFLGIGIAVVGVFFVIFSEDEEYIEPRKDLNRKAGRKQYVNYIFN